MNPVNNALIFLISTFIDLYVFVLILRIILVWRHAQYWHPIVQFIIKITGFLVDPLRKIFPMVKRIELASIFLVIVLEILKFYLVNLIAANSSHISGLVVLACADICRMIVNIFFYAIIFQILLNWLMTAMIGSRAAHSYAQIYPLLSTITNPIMRPFQRLIPPVGGFDISPIFALLSLQLIVILLVEPLYTLGTGMN